MTKLKTLLLIITLFSAVIAKSQDTITLDKVVATIGSKIVLDSDIQIQYLQMKARGAATTNSKCEIYEDQLFQKLLLNQSELDSIEITEAEIQTELDSRLALFIEQMGSVEALEDYFNKTLFEIEEQFYDIIEEQLLTQRMQYNITENLKVTPADVRNFYNNTDNDSLPIIDTKYEIQLIRIYPLISEEEEQIAYDKIEGFKTKIEAGEKKFETLALLYSEDVLSAKSGGELGFMGRGELDAEFAKAAFSLEQDEISDVIKSAFGYHIIQLIERKGEKVNCRHILVSSKVSGTAKFDAKNKIDSIKTLILLDSLTFEEASIKFSEDENTNKNNGIMINPYTGTQKFDETSLSAEIKYIINKMAVGEISKPQETTDDSGVTCYDIYKLKSKKEAHIANLEEDYQDIMSLALAIKQQEVMNKWIKEKQKSVYIHISEDYKTCNFTYTGWLK